MPVELGDRVYVIKLRCCGDVSYIGELQGKSGLFYGVELTSSVGKNDGSFQGRSYFKCATDHGIFVRKENISKVSNRKSDIPHHSSTLASNSHDKNEEYMQRFEDGLKYLNLDDSSNKEPVESKEPVLRFSENLHEYPSSRTGLSSADFGQGPSDPSGTVFDASDVPILCMSLSPDGSECAVGGADHGLRVFEVATGKEQRNLYSKRYGHSDWVTSVEYCPDGSLVSASMDKTICWWEKKRTACVDLLGHTHSVSKVKVSNDGSHLFSSSYDKTLRLWSLTQRSSSAVHCFKGHRAPVLDFCFADGRMLSGDRGGMAIMWDLVQGCCALQLEQHKGHVTALHSGYGLGRRICFTGDQGGTLRAWDFRSGATAIERCDYHPGGAVNEIVVALENLVVTAGADKTISISDVRKNLQLVHRLSSHRDFIYSLQASGNYILSGAGDGMMLVHELNAGKLMYGLGANEAGVRCIECRDDFIVAAGDDGNAIVYNYC